MKGSDVKKRVLVTATLLLVSLALLAPGCNIKQTVRTVGELVKNTYYDTQTVSTVKVGDIDVAYKQFGSGEPLVMITGYSTTMDTWSPQFLQALASKFKVIVFDNRGMGKTTAGTAAFTIDQFADDTAGLIGALGFGKANVLGWSIGGDIALDVVVRHPDRVIRLVSYAGDCGGLQKIPAPEYKAVLKSIQDVNVPAKRVLASLYPGWYMEANPNYWKEFPFPRELSKLKNIEAQNKAYEDWAGVYDQLPSIIRPVLVAGGTLDVSTPFANAPILLSRIPGSKLAEFKGAGHGLQYMYPYDFAYAIIEFLSSK
jgi:pimeloyl-ACP methyl ester carboxylesterase/predicted small secreted protein